MAGRARRSLALASAVALAVLALAGCSQSTGTGALGGPSTASAPQSGPVTAAAAASGIPSLATVKPSFSGCALLTEADIVQAIGADPGPPKGSTASGLPGTIAHSGCHYTGGAVAVGYDVSTFPPGAGLAARKDQILAGAAPHSTAVKIGDGGFLGSAGGIEVLSFFQGNNFVGISVHGKPGEALTLAKIIASRLSAAG